MTTPSEDLLSAYLDGEVSADERALVERRLAESEEWRAVLAEARSTRELVRGLPVQDAPAGFWDAVLRGDLGDDDRGDDGGEGEDGPGAEPAPPTALDARRRRRTRVAGWVAGVAAAAAVAAVIFVPGETRVKPAVGTLVTSHAARSSVSEEPMTELAPVATPLKVGR